MSRLIAQRSSLSLVPLLALLLTLDSMGASYAQTILQYGFDFTSGDVTSNGSIVFDDSGKFNDGLVLTGHGGAYSSDVPPSNTQFTTGVGSLDLSGANAIGTDPTSSTTGAGLITGLDILNFDVINNAGGLTVEAWVKDIAAGMNGDGESALGHIVSVAGVYGLLVDDSGVVLAINGHNFGDSPTRLLGGTSEWTHLAAVYGNTSLDSETNELTADIELFVNGSSAATTAGSVIPIDLDRGAGVGNHTLVNNGGVEMGINEPADGLIFEPRVTLGALAPSAFTIANPIPLPTLVSLEIDRSTGATSIIGGSEITDVIGYEITSPGGALDPGPGQWTPVTGNYDANGDRSVDDDAWVIVTESTDRDNLSEMQDTGAADSGAIGASQVIDLGTPWIQNPNEDISAQLITSDASIPLQVTFVGNNDLSFEVGDMDFDGDIDSDDWPIYRAGVRENLSGLSLAEAYQMGDLNGDGVNDSADFLLFKEIFIAANSPAAFEAMVAGVPEPSTILAMATCLGVFAMFRRIRPLRAQPAILLCVGAACCQIPLPASAQTVLQYGFDFTSGTVAANGGTVSDDSGNNNSGFAFGGVGGAYTSDLPPSGFLQNTTGIGSINMAEADGVSTGTGVFDGEALNGLAAADIDLGGGVTVEAWVKNVSSPTSNTGHLGILGGMLGIAVTSDGDIQAVYGDNIFNEEIPTATVDTSSWTHIAAVYTDDPDSTTGVNGEPDSNLAFSKVELFVDGLSAATDADGHTFAFGFLNRAFGFGTHPVFSESDLAEGLIFEPRVSLGALTPDEFTIDLPDPLALDVNTATGAVTLVNPNSDVSFDIDYYEILSDVASGSSLDPSGWQRLAGQDGFPGGDGNGGGWEDAGSPDTGFLGEAYLTDTSIIAANASISLGNAFDPIVGAQDLAFNYTVGGRTVAGTVDYVSSPSLPGDFNRDNVVDGDDFLLWQRDPSVGALTDWEQHFGESTVAGAAVPEPCALALALLLLPLTTRTMRR